MIYVAINCNMHIIFWHINHQEADIKSIYYGFNGPPKWRLSGGGRRKNNLYSYLFPQDVNINGFAFSSYPLIQVWAVSHNVVCSFQIFTSLYGASMSILFL